MGKEKYNMCGLRRKKGGPGRAESCALGDKTLKEKPGAKPPSAPLPAQRSSGREGNHGNRKLLRMHLNEGAMFQPQQAELGGFSHVVLGFRVRDTRKGLWDLPL